MDRVEKFQQLGEQGPQLAGALVSAWEDWAIDPNDETSSRLNSANERGVAFARELVQRLQLPQLPDRFAGFPFMGSFSTISEYCWGYRQDAVAGIWALRCPNVPVRPPFAAGDALLTFLSGSLVAVQMEVPNYQEAVRAIASKYGKPSTGSYVNGNWKASDSPSYAFHTSFDWTLNGGRIRVGRMKAKPFVVFIRDERDQAIDSSF